MVLTRLGGRATSPGSEIGDEARPDDRRPERVAGARIDRPEIGYWRTASGEEVDFVIEAEGRLLPIEVKASARPRLADAVHLRSFRAEYGKRARAGLLLHTGSTLEWLARDVLAAPWWRVL